MANKQTAIEWLVEQIYATPAGPTPAQLDKIVKQAKAMEKEQIKDAWINSLTKGDYNSAEQYYNQTFKSE